MQQPNSGQEDNMRDGAMKDAGAYGSQEQTWRRAGMAQHALVARAGYLGQPLRVLVLALAAAPARPIRLV